MAHNRQFYIDGEWVEPSTSETLAVIDPATEQQCAVIAMGNSEDVNRAVTAARTAFKTYGLTSREERLTLLRRILETYLARAADLAATMSREMGAPIVFAREAQVTIGAEQLKKMIETLETFLFQTLRGTTLITREPIGVCGLITPWNWPVNQIMCKVAPALAAGCTIVLKPSEIAPLNAIVFAEILHDAGVPKGVFNLLNGDGSTVGEAIASHPDVDMISITGSTRAGIRVAKAAADTVKRVHQELGGKSANIILEDVDLERAVSNGVTACFRNSGQSCSAPTRMLIPRKLYADAIEIARRTAESFRVGPPEDIATNLGPLVSLAQYDKVQHLIHSGIDEGAEIVTGGPGRPSHLDVGYYARPTVFAQVRPEMTIAREEIFGPVLSMVAYEDEDEAVAYANATVYGLASYVQCNDLDRARRVAGRMRSGSVHINYPPWDFSAPFGGYKQSGNGREYADFGLDSFLETKGIIGYQRA